MKLQKNIKPGKDNGSGVATMLSYHRQNKLRQNSMAGEQLSKNSVVNKKDFLTKLFLIQLDFRSGLNINF
jgi:hypothetical protein